MVRPTQRNDVRSAGNADAIVIGAGHSGLATSYCLTERSIDHIVLERGEVANSWRKERWDSLRLLTPNWQSRLPGFSYSGDDPDGFMTMPQVIDFIDDYAKFCAAPIQTDTTVTAVCRDENRYRLSTDAGEWACRTVVIASGACNAPVVPAFCDAVPTTIQALTPHQYRGPEQLEPGGVLVVGASATGLQLAEEIHRFGHPVTIAVGEHVRMPRMYRGRDILWWMDKAGVLDERYDEVEDIVRARRLPSPQLVGTPDRSTLDLNSLTTIGVELVGRFAGVRDGVAQFSGSLRNVCALADLKMGRLLDTIDEWATTSAGASQFDPSERFEATRVDKSSRLTLDLMSGEIRTVLWATGFRPDYSWLDAPVFDRKGHIKHDGGIVDSPGMYVVGLPVLRRRKSSFIHGAEDDVRDLTAHLVNYLDGHSRRM